MAAAVTLSADHVLHVDGTSGNDTITIEGTIIPVRLGSGLPTSGVLATVKDSTGAVLCKASFIVQTWTPSWPVPSAATTSSPTLPPSPRPTYGGQGSDTLQGGSGVDTLFAADGPDGAEVAGALNTLFGKGGNDDLWGSALGDTLNGGDGNDELNGGSGNDTLHGGAGQRCPLRLLRRTGCLARAATTKSTEIWTTIRSSAAAATMCSSAALAMTIWRAAPAPMSSQAKPAGTKCGATASAINANTKDSMYFDLLDSMDGNWGSALYWISPTVVEGSLKGYAVYKG